MRTTITLDDALIAEAREISGINENSVLFREALEALIQRESARQLVQIGGTVPDQKSIPRRRADP